MLILQVPAGWCACHTMAPLTASTATRSPARVVTNSRLWVPLGVETFSTNAGAPSAVLGRVVWNSWWRPLTLATVRVDSVELLPWCDEDPANWSQLHPARQSDAASRAGTSRNGLSAAATARRRGCDMGHLNVLVGSGRPSGTPPAPAPP